MKSLMRLNILALLVCVFVAGCGYHVSGGRGDTSKALGFELSSVAVPVFKNETLRAGVEGVITNALVDELVNTIEVKHMAGAEAVIKGVVKSYELSARSFDVADVVSEYRLKVTYSINIFRVADDTLLWHDNNVSAYADFLVDTSSVAITKDRESMALSEIARESARLVRERMVSPIR